MKIILKVLMVLFYSSVLLANPLVLAPGYSPLTFSAPKVGSYSLPTIMKASNGKVLTTTNQALPLYDLMGDKVVLMSFIYSTCSDVNGCPLATGVFHKINRRLQKEPELAKKLRLLTLSFNPLHDTPEQMSLYGQGFKNKIVDWQFLTTQSEQYLQPILEQYGQNIQKNYDDKGKFTGTFSHILRVYLIDKNKNIRNIYSLSFLHADTLVNDVETLLEEVSQQQESPNTAATGIDLLENNRRPQLGLPIAPDPDPKNNPINAVKIALGRKLFFDRRLSLNNTFSCAMCHIPEQGFSSNEMATAVGIEGRTVRRNSPTIYNLAYATLLFHDGREDSLEQQVWGPLLAHNEMGNPSIGFVVNKIKSFYDYQGLFEQAFASPADMLTIGQALASYERSLVSANSPFDQWYFGKQAKAISREAKKGFKLFTGKAACSHCHTVTKDHALLTDNKLHNTGVGYQQSMGTSAQFQTIQIAPDVFIEVDREQLESITEAKVSDLGRYEISQHPQDRWKYKTPSLRNIGLTAPYMHNGSLATLEEVIRFYNKGGVMNENLDDRVTPLNLSEIEISYLLAFLQELTGSNVNSLVQDALAAPIGSQ